jgi:antitoxin (DNA-binding transcriptional repressor) of toxin-antitoxin stability system
MKENDASTGSPMEIGPFQAKTQLSHLLRQTRSGKTFIITQRGKPVAELRPVTAAPSTTSGWGDLEGKIQTNDSFCDSIAEMQDYMN